MELDPAVYTSKISKRQSNSFLASTPMSENVPMDHDGKPSGLPAVTVATPSVATHLSVTRCFRVHPDLGFGFGVGVPESGVGWDGASVSRSLR